MAVPVFLAISGVLMLGREVSIKDLWYRRIPKIAAVLMLFSAIFYGVEILSTGGSFSLRDFIFGLYESNWNHAYWYLYAYLAFLMALPILSRLAQCMDFKSYGYLLTLAFVFRCFIPCIEAWRWGGVHTLNADFDLSFMTCDIVLYPLMGYFLHHRVSTVQLKKALPAIVVAAAGLTLISCHLTCRDYYVNWVAYTQTYHNLFAPVVCASVFAAARVLFERMDEQCILARTFSVLGRYTFGVYLLHMLATIHLAGLGGLFGWMSMTGILPIIGSFIYCVIMMLVCLPPVWLLRKIPLIGRLIS